MRAVVDRRVRVQVVRRRLEEAAASAVTTSRGERPEMHQCVGERLLLLSADVEASEQAAVHDLARRARSIYRATSGVMHSRRAFGDVPEYLVQEWEATVEDVERLLGSVRRSGTSTEV